MTFIRQRKNEIISGLIFIAVFYLLGYVFLNPNDFFARDDGIITMSHARNLVDYGFIGVNPSGDKLCATSAPLQMAIYAIVYFFLRLDPYVFTLLQTIICTFFLGCIFFKFFKDDRLGLLYSAVGAFCLTRIYNFLGWHASGMENALFHVFYLWTVYILYNFVKTNKINYWASIVIFLSAIVRYESVYHIAPLLVIFSIYWVVKNKNWMGFKFSLLVGIVWAGFMGVQYLYFGSFFPHTAFAQSIDLGGNLLNLAKLNMDQLSRQVSASLIIVLFNEVILVPVFILMWLLIRKTASKSENGFLYLLCLSLTITGVFNPLIFGITRIHPARTTSFLAVIVILTGLLFITEMLAVPQLTRKQKRKLKKQKNPTLLQNNIKTAVYVTVFCSLIWFCSLMTPNYYLGWTTKGFEHTNKSFAAAAKANNIHRATVSNPDLGIISWRKQFNIVDIGLLGSPIMTHITGEERIINYYCNYAAPDLIECHGYWSQKYEFLVNSDAFKKLYTPYTKISYYKGNSKWPDGIWIRKDMLKGSGSAERLFYDRLAKNLTIENIEQEFKNTEAAGNLQKVYISRTVYKFIPELKEKGLYNDTKKIFAKYHASKYDEYLLSCSQDATAWERVVRQFNDGTIN